MAWQMLGWRGQCGGSCHSPWALPVWLRTCPYLQPCAAPSALHITPGFRGSGLFSLHLGNDGDNLHYWSLQHAHGWKENRKDKHLCVGMSIHTHRAPFQLLWSLLAVANGHCALHCCRHCVLWAVAQPRGAVPASEGLVDAFIPWSLKRPRRWYATYRTPSSTEILKG